MSATFSFSVANPSDDDELRTIIRKTHMPGPVSLSFCREPSFFLAEHTGCIRSETIVCRRNDTGRIIGFGGRSLRAVYVHGRETTMWYLHSLRLLAEERGGTALLRGYQFFHSLPNDSGTPYFLTTILDGNDSAKKVLEQKRTGMPTYTRVGTMVSYLIPIRVKARMKNKTATVIKCPTEKIDPAVACIRKWNAQHDFAPVYTEADLHGLGNPFPGFSFENLYISLSGNVVTGTLGIWDQQCFKQSVVANYDRYMKLIRGVYNTYASVAQLPFLPKVGEEVRTLHAPFISVQDNSPDILDSMLRTAISDWSGIGYDWLVVGFCSNNPLGKVAAKRSARQLSSGVYLVHWENDEVIPVIRNPHLEIALL